MIFTAQEVKDIRTLATMSHRFETKSQLNALVLLARRASIDELQLEIEIRCKASKLQTGFAASLSDKLSQLTSLGKEERDQEKRALFLKNISKLI